MRQFSGEHIATLMVTAVAAGLLVWAPRRRGGSWVVAVSRGLAVLILAAYATEYVANVAQGTWSVRYSLPLQLTDAVTLASIVALWSPRPVLVELVYFWALTASLQAVVTPDLGQAFPSIFFFTYFTAHVGAVLAAFFLVFGRRLLPRPGAVWRVYALTALVAALAAVGDLLTGGNYMFLRNKPEHSSLLSVMGPWPWYIVSGAAFGLAVFLGLDGLVRVLRQRERSEATAPSFPHAV